MFWTTIGAQIALSHRLPDGPGAGQLLGLRAFAPLPSQAAAWQPLRGQPSGAPAARASAKSHHLQQQHLGAALGVVEVAAPSSVVAIVDAAGAAAGAVALGGVVGSVLVAVGVAFVASGGVLVVDDVSIVVVVGVVAVVVDVSVAVVVEVVGVVVMAVDVSVVVDVELGVSQYSIMSFGA